MKAFYGDYGCRDAARLPNQATSWVIPGRAASSQSCRRCIPYLPRRRATVRIRASSAARTRGKAASHFGWHAILRYVAAGIIPLGAGQMAASDGGNSLARFVTWLPPLPLAVQVQQSAARDWVHQPPASQCLSAKPCAGTDFCPKFCPKWQLGHSLSRIIFS